MTTNAKSATSGNFEVETDEFGSVRADELLLEDLGNGFKVSVREGRGGTMETKKFFQLGFPLKSPSAVYDAKDLSASGYREWSQDHDYQYVANSGSVTVSYADSSRKTEGEFDIVMELKGDPTPPGPRRLRVTGRFELKNA